MSFTARHYNSIQRIFRERRTDLKERRQTLGAVSRVPGGPSEVVRYLDGAESELAHVQQHIGRMLAADNPRFDLTRYNMECEPK